MTDEVSLRCTNRKVFNLVIANAEIREPMHPYQMQWMSHWSQASSSSSFQSHKHHAFANVIKNKIEEGCYLPVDTNVTYDLGKHDSASYMLQTANSRNNLDSFCSKPKLPASSMNLEDFTLYQFQNSTGLSSEQTHFPMIEIKRRIQSIVAPKKKTSFDTMKAKMKEQVLPLNCSAIGCRKRKSQKFSDATQYLLITKEVGENSCHNDQIVEGSSVSAKGTAFFQKLTVPTMLCDHGQHEENLQTLVSSTNDVEAVDHTDAQFMMKEKENLAEIDIKHIDVNDSQSSPEVGNSSESCKVNQEDVNPITKTSEAEDSNSSRTESMDALSKKPSNPPTECTERDSDPNSKWVKRIRPSLLDSTPLSTKRFKKGDSSSIEMQNLLSRVVSYNRTISDLSDPYRYPEKGIPWIRRWCKSSTSKETESPKVTPLSFEAGNSKAVWQFPSLAAMALMGKQATNYRPCEFRRRGSTTIWNI